MLTAQCMFRPKWVAAMVYITMQVAITASLDVERAFFLLAWSLKSVLRNTKILPRTYARNTMETMTVME